MGIVLGPTFPCVRFLFFEFFWGPAGFPTALALMQCDFPIGRCGHNPEFVRVLRQWFHSVGLSSWVHPQFLVGLVLGCLALLSAEPLFHFHFLGPKSRLGNVTALALALALD